MEEFNDQPNGICLECWEKTEIFDKFYKSVQAAHLILLNTKYKKDDIEDVEVKCENACTENPILEKDLSAEISNDGNIISEHNEDHKIAEHEDIITNLKRNQRTRILKKEIFEEKHYSPLELEMEAKTADYFQMNCDLCLHQFNSWNDARTHYLDRHNILKPYLRCCNRKFFLRSRIIEHIIWHVDPSAFQYVRFLPG